VPPVVDKEREARRGEQGAGGEKRVELLKTIYPQMFADVLIMDRSGR